jgi:hypothetical protein
MKEKTGGTKMTDSEKSVQDVQDLFDSSPMGDDAKSVAIANLNTSAMALAACQGADPFELGASEATIVVYVVDQSGSMYDVADEVLASLIESVESMKESKPAAALTLTQINFNYQAEVVFANRPVEEIKAADIAYYADGMTALYDATLGALTGSLAYEEQLLQAGLSTKGIVVVFSDGADNYSHPDALNGVRLLATELQSRENWVLAFVGFQTLESVNYEAIARNMGFPIVLVIDLDEDEYSRRHQIRQAFRLASKSVIRQSQTMVDPNAVDNFFNV